jgi:heat shock protein HslJ
MTLTGRRAWVAASAVVLVAALVLSLRGGLVTRQDYIDSRSATEGLRSTQVDLEAHVWELTPEGTSGNVHSEQPVTVIVDGGAIGGTGPCNPYRGRLDVDGDDQVTISRIATTTRACDPATTRSEAAFVAALEAVDHVEVSDRSMVLTNSHGVRLAFRAGMAPG